MDVPAVRQLVASFVTRITVTNDGHQYLAQAAGGRVARPFHYRWLIGRLCGTDPARWQQMAYLSAGLLAAALWAYTGQLAAMVVPFALAGIWFNVRYPVLVDLPAMVAAVSTAVCVQRGWWPAAVVFAVVAGCMKETGPLFAAAYAWSPVPLVGMVAPAVRHLWKAGAQEGADEAATFALQYPVRASRRAHAGRWFDWRLWVAPWGPLAIGFGPTSPQTAVTLLLAYGQCVLATDTVRLYVWAAPVVAHNLFDFVPAAWTFPLAVGCMFWPLKGDGQ